MIPTPDLVTHWSLVLSNYWVGIFASYCCSVTKSGQNLCDPMKCSMSGFPVLYCLLELTQTHVYWVDNAVQPSHPLSPLSLPDLNLSQHQGFFPKSQFFKSGGQSIGASASASILPMNIQGWFQGWFRINWFDLLAVQGTLKSLLQHHSSKASVFQHSAFFMVQLSHWYMTTGKTIPLTRWIFINKVISLLLMLSVLVIALYPRGKYLLILWLHSQSAVILEPKKIKPLTISIFSPSICHEVMELDAMIFIFWMLSF